MRLLFDENLSPELVGRLGEAYPESSHVHELGLGKAPDEEIWSFAREHGLAIVAEDADFHSLGFRRGHPPKVIWIRRGNCSTNDVAELLMEHHPLVLKFAADSEAALLEIA